MIATYPDDISGGNNLAILYSQMGEIEKAIERWRACIQAGTEDVVIFRNLAGAYENIGAYDKSIEVQESYIKNFGDSAIMRRDLASTYLALGKYDLALAELDKAVALSPADWENLRARGDIYLYMDNLSGAEEEYRKLLAREERDGRGWGWLRLTDLYALQGRFEEAKKAGAEDSSNMGKARAEPLDQDFRINLSYLERRSGHPEAALRELDKAWTSAVAEEDFWIREISCSIRGWRICEKKAMSEAQDVAARLKAAVDQAPNKKLPLVLSLSDGDDRAGKEEVFQGRRIIQAGTALIEAWTPRSTSCSPTAWARPIIKLVISTAHAGSMKKSFLWESAG